ncbi:hypothetical protein [Candidatus Contubernalis alkaliaceticus]|uniref:hypothetical protein n=1 Tax=Candidatus Contubernalis alkaliaceticus TaxID=338645 RepID=UPI001F4BD174|nr:hypothetical protein [Candidatus Contubernalis alkalaceticus]UNC92217.1 hypothetical protein HUE98_09015 [Candidatus Contubernalis alkalaceticus]
MIERKPIRRKFIFRTIVFLVILYLYMFNLEMLTEIINYRLGDVKVYHVIWLLLMLEMLQILLPKYNRHISCGKIFARHFREKKVPYDKKEVLEYTKKYNRRAGWAGFFWLTLLFLIGIFYFARIIDLISIHLIAVFFYFSDEFCINVWCPFRAWIVRNKCCNACRIYNWSHFMIFSPFIFIFSFWTYSLLVMSLVIFIQWEYLHYKYPERFSELSNANLKCGDCPERVQNCRFV